MAKISTSYIGFEGRFWPRSLSFIRFGEASSTWAHSSLHPHVEKSFVLHPDVGLREQRHQIGSVHSQQPILDLDVGKLPLNDPKRVFHQCADARLELLNLVHDGAHGLVILQASALAGLHGNVPVHVRLYDLNLFTLVHTPVTRTDKHIGLLTVQQLTGLREDMRMGRRRDDGVNMPRVCIRSNVRFHKKVPMITFIGLAHLEVKFHRAVFGEAWHRNQDCTYHSTSHVIGKVLQTISGRDSLHNYHKA